MTPGISERSERNDVGGINPDSVAYRDKLTTDN